MRWFSHFSRVSVALRVFPSSLATRFQQSIQHYLVYSFAQPLSVSCRSWFRHCCLVHSKFCNLPYDIISNNALRGVLSWLSRTNRREKFNWKCFSSWCRSCCNYIVWKIQFSDICYGFPEVWVGLLWLLSRFEGKRQPWRHINIDSINILQKLWKRRKFIPPSSCWFSCN